MSRLTTINTEAIRLAVDLLQKGRIELLVLSSNLDTGHLEAALRLELAHELGVDLDKVDFLVQNNSQTQEEVFGFGNKYPDAKSLVLITERWQLPRFAEAFRVLWPQTTVVGQASFVPGGHEWAYEEPKWKAVFFRYRVLWIIRNILMYLVTPTVCRRMTKR
jgi:hypothetical protein